MKALSVLYGASLSPEAFEPVFSGASAFSLALERARAFPGTEKLLLLGRDGGDYPGLPPEALVARAGWTLTGLFQTLAEASAGFDLTYFAWADCPLLDPVLAGKIADRHLRYAAEYSYADGWPYGLAPELLSPGTAGILAKIAEGADGPVERDSLFSVLQRDINSFDIETEISGVDLRNHRLSLAADSRRGLLLLGRLAGAGLSGAEGAEGIIAGKPELLRTLPAFYPVQVSGPCPQACALCPYPRAGAKQRSAGGLSVTERKDFMEPPRFEELLDKIALFSGDAVVDLSLWGELSLHPRKLELIRMVLARPALSLVIETSGIGWKGEELEALAAEARGAAPRKSRALPSPLSWIVSLDTADGGRYREIRGPGFAEALECAGKLKALFPRDAYVQAVRVKGAEDDIEKAYRSWKEAGANVIIQKYDDFCGALPDLQASDLSPVRRQPCWHLMRDMPVLLDGTVPRCREDTAALAGGGALILGNAFTEPLETLWSRGEASYREHCSGIYGGICAGCHEYYTYNF
jgi:spiro-SPASM protein